MNDMLMQAGAMIPLVHRGDVSAHSNTLNGVLMNSWDSELWNIADWTARSNPHLTFRPVPFPGGGPSS